MTPTNEASPKGKGKETEWRQARNSPNSSKEDTASDWSEEDDNPSGEDRFRMALAAAHRHAKETHSSDGSYQKDKQVAGTKRQRSEIPPETQRRPKEMKYQEFATADFANDANNTPPNAQTKSKNWQGAGITVPSPGGAGYIANLDPLMSREQGLQKIIMDQMAQENPPGEYIRCAAPAIRRSCGSVIRDTMDGHKYDQRRVGIYPGQRNSQAASQTHSVTRSQDSRTMSPAQVHIKDSGNSRTGADQVPTVLEDEISSTAPSMGTKDDHYPD